MPYSRGRVVEPAHSPKCPCRNHTNRESTVAMILAQIREKDPVSMLTEYGTRNCVTVAFIEETKSGRRSRGKFFCYVKLNGEKFGAAHSAPNKADGRKAVATEALIQLARLQQIRVGFLEQLTFPLHPNHALGAKVAAVCHQRFNEFALNHPVWLDSVDVIAAIVLESPNNFTLIAMATGNGAIFTRDTQRDWKSIKGCRLYTMSCSDKLLLWNTVGLQGALLTHFVKPIYMNSLTIGDLCDVRHLCRAVCCRLNWSTVPEPYRQNHPILTCWGQEPPAAQAKMTVGTTRLSVNWTFGDETPEVVDGPKGILHVRNPNGDQGFSRLAKRNLFEEFKNICAMSERSDLFDSKNYWECKKGAIEYQSVKWSFKRILGSCNFGSWMEKPTEEKFFY